MKKVIKTLLALITVVAVIAIGYMIVLFPTHKYSEYITTSESFDIGSILLKSVPSNFSLQNKKMETTISLTEEELKALILSEAKKSGNIDEVDISIEADKIFIYATQKVLKYIPTEVSILFETKIEDGKSKLVLKDSKLGKLDLDKENVLKKMRDSKIMFFDVRPLGGEIILEDKELKDLITVNAIRFEEDKASVDIEVDIDSIEDFTKLMIMLTKK